METRTADPDLAHGAANKANPIVTAIKETLTDETLGMILNLAEESVRVNYDKVTGLYSPEKFEADGIAMMGANLHILITDIGYLGYVNEVSGHSGGDEYKRRVANIVGGKTEEMKMFMKDNEIESKGYALTRGDEMGILMEGSKEKAELLATKIREEVEKIGKITPNSELNASISIGMVSEDEFGEELATFFAAHESSDKKLTTFKFLARAAIFRSELDKVKERLREMVTVQKNDPEKFERLSIYLGKGVIGVDEKLRKRLSESTDYEADSETLIKEIIRGRKEIDLQEATDPLQKFMIEMELKMLGE